MKMFYDEKLIIKAALTGMIPNKEDTPYVPIYTDEIIKDGYRAIESGATVLHIHARDETGKPTYKKEIFKEIFDGIREKYPDIIICATTSGRVDPQVEHRSEVLSLNPEMASLTIGSMNFPKYPSVNPPETIKKLAEIMKNRNILPELEIFEAGFINYAIYLVKKGYLKNSLHFNLLLGSLGAIPANLRDLTYIVDSLPEDATWSATGIGRFQTQINTAAIIMGGHVRVGIEDSIYYYYPTKELATNEKLIKRIVRISRELGRDIAKIEDTRRILGLY
jgi:uncharacterized protein (DUF849 family)